MSKLEDVGYTPSAWGSEYHASRLDELLGAGAAGPGKSMVLLMDPIAQVIVEHERCTNKSHPHRMGWGDSTGWALHLRRTRPMLEQTISRAFRIFRKMDPGVAWNATSNTFTWSSGFKYQFGHCKDPNSWEGYMSNEYTHLSFDELTQFLEEQYVQICTRVRSTDPVLRDMLKTRAMSNPLMRMDETVVIRNPHWVREYFVDPFPEGRRVIRKLLRMNDGSSRWHTRMYIPAKLSDNPDKVFVAQYEEKLQAAPAYIRAALLYGDWYVTPDSFYGAEWNKDIHTCEPFEIPREWPQFRSMDWGFKSPGCIHWWALDPDGTLWCQRELTFRGKDPVEVSKMVRELETQMGLWRGKRSRITGPADTQLWEERGNRGESMATTFAGCGVIWAKADKRSRQRNAQRVLTRLKDHRGGTVTPGMVFFRTCTKAIQTIPAIQTSQKNSEEPADGGDDHWHDSVCYAAAYASRGADALQRPEDDDDGDFREEKPKQKRGLYGFGYGYD